MCDLLDIRGYLVTMVIEKAFDSSNLIRWSWISVKCFKIFGFGQNFIPWVKLLLNNQQSCATNGGFTTQYFNLEKEVRQDDPISAYLFILALEVLFNQKQCWNKRNNNL